ncbi:MAG TPA: hypothetical protein VNB94_08675 [Mycobacteriales bacterium]|nr:hypothetical protein [Mycobacteriales bacterium]
MAPRRLLAVLALLVVGLLGVGVTAAVRRTNDNAAATASPRVTSSPTEDATAEPLPSDPATEAPVPAETAVPLPAATPTSAATPAAGGTGGPAGGSGSGSSSGAGGSSQALGPPAPAMPQTGPVTAVLFVAAISAFLAIVVHRRFFR